MLKGTIRTLVKKMFEVSGNKFSDDIDFTDDKNPWYKNVFWTKENEAEFFKWAEDFIYNNKQARKDLGLFRNKNYIRRNIQILHMYTPTLKEVKSEPQTDIRHSSKKED